MFAFFSKTFTAFQTVGSCTKLTVTLCGRFFFQQKSFAPVEKWKKSHDFFVEFFFLVQDFFHQPYAGSLQNMSSGLMWDQVKIHQDRRQRGMARCKSCFCDFQTPPFNVLSKEKNPSWKKHEGANNLYVFFSPDSSSWNIWHYSENQRLISLFHSRSQDFL